MPSIRVTLGIDEAGRGPAIGPMVIAAVALDSKAAASLTRTGLRDSKSFGAGEDAHGVRVQLAASIRKRAIFVQLIEVHHDEIDVRVCRGELNVLERELATKLIDAAPTTHKIICDGKRMFAPLAGRYPHLESRDHAEDHHASVAAASVVAKAHRDTLYAKIRARYEPEFGAITGGGYVNDGTRQFLRAFATRYGRVPDETRRSWPHPYLTDILGNVQLPRPQTEMFEDDKPLGVGHPPALIVGPGGSRQLESDPGLIGVGMVEGLEGGNDLLGSGESLLIYTDGLPDAMDPNDVAFNTDKILAVLGQNASSQPGEILDQVEKAVADHVAPGQPHDDINLVLVQHPAG